MDNTNHVTVKDLVSCSKCNGAAKQHVGFDGYGPFAISCSSCGQKTKYHRDEGLDCGESEQRSRKEWQEINKGA